MMAVLQVQPRAEHRDSPKVRLYMRILGFVAAEVLLGFGIKNVLTSHRIILPQSDLVRSIHSIFGRVVVTMPGFLGHQTYDFSLAAFFRHNSINLNRSEQTCKQDKY